MNLSGKRSVVTGAGQGIGQAIALYLAKCGADVAVFDLNAETAEQTAAQVRSMERRALAISINVADSEQVNAAVARVIAEFGGIDILVNCAGWTNVQPFIENTEATWDKVIAINLKGPVLMCHAVLTKTMMAQGHGRILNIGSDAGRVGSLGETVYAGAKGGVISFSKSLAREVARYGITVNSVCPGPTQTPLLQEHRDHNPKVIDAMIKATPLRKLGKPEDIAAAVGFLVSEEAGHITGQTLSVSGGLTMM